MCYYILMDTIVYMVESCQNKQHTSVKIIQNICNVVLEFIYY